MAGLWVGSSAACPGDTPIQVLVPYAAGGSVDATTRVLARAVATRMGRSLNVVNVPGASGLIAVRQLMSSARDGCTVLSASLNNVVLLPLQNAHAGYVPTDLLPLARVGSSGFTLVAGPGLGVRDVAGLQASAAAGRALRAGHPGVDSLQALALKILEARHRMAMVHVPYSGAAPLINDLAGGHIDIAVLAQPAALPLISRGAVVAIDAARWPDGTPIRSWAGWFAARGVAPAALAALQRALGQVLADASVVQALADMGVESTASTPESFAREISQSGDQIRRLLGGGRLGDSPDR